MSDRVPPDLDLLPDGSFRPRRPPLAIRVFRWAVIVALLAGALALAALAGRWRLNRRRLSDWTVGWLAVEPQWSHLE
jgi:hypothetical protein